MEKVDVYREHRDEYVLAREPRLLTIGAGVYLTVTGSGSPASAEFKRKIGALYGCAYTVKFESKLKKARDFKVGALEALWWTEKHDELLRSPRATWKWKLLMRVPPFVTARSVTAALAALEAKGRPVADVKREVLREGRVVQALHVGPYGREPATLAKMEAFARAHGLRFHGKHHEIYLSDPRRVPPARLRTLLRHSVKLRSSVRSR